MLSAPKKKRDQNPHKKTTLFHYIPSIDTKLSHILPKYLQGEIYFEPKEMQAFYSKIKDSLSGRMDAVQAEGDAVEMSSDGEEVKEDVDGKVEGGDTPGGPEAMMVDENVA